MSDTQVKTEPTHADDRKPELESGPSLFAILKERIEAADLPIPVKNAALERLAYLGRYPDPHALENKLQLIIYPKNGGQIRLTSNAVLEALNTTPGFKKELTELLFLRDMEVELKALALSRGPSLGEFLDHGYPGEKEELLMWLLGYERLTALTDGEIQADKLELTPSLESHLETDPVYGEHLRSKVAMVETFNRDKANLLAALDTALSEANKNAENYRNIRDNPIYFYIKLGTALDEAMEALRQHVTARYTAKGIGSLSTAEAFQHKLELEIKYGEELFRELSSYSHLVKRLKADAAVTGRVQLNERDLNETEYQLVSHLKKMKEAFPSDNPQMYENFRAILSKPLALTERLRRDGQAAEDYNEIYRIHSSVSRTDGEKYGIPCDIGVPPFLPSALSSTELSPVIINVRKLYETLQQDFRILTDLSYKKTSDLRREALSRCLEAQIKATFASHPELIQYLKEEGLLSSLIYVSEGHLMMPDGKVTETRSDMRAAVQGVNAGIQP